MRVNLPPSLCKSPAYLKHLVPVYTCDLGTGIVVGQYKGLDATVRNQVDNF
jgi:hypothetical protein